MPSSPADTDRNLLFGVLALQADLIDPDRFAEACTVWATRKDTPLADQLVQRGWLTPADRDDVEKLLRRKLARHRGDARASLAEVTTDPVRQSLAGIGDKDVRQSLSGPSPPLRQVLLATTAYVPEALDRYTLSRLHSIGGIGRVWLAHDPSLGRDVALKELRPERADNPAVWARFLKEAQITGQLEHPGIVPIYEVGRRPTDQSPFYTMRFVRGRTLAQAVTSYHQKREQGEAGPLELRLLLGAFVGVCQAVAYAHSRGVIHRDLKPQNVVLGDFGEVIVLDWGLARLIDQPEAEDAPAPLAVSAPSDTEKTMLGQVLGTPAYMAPEQAEGRHDLLSPATDVHGLGGILYEILAGQPPFPGSDTQEVLQEVIHEPPRRPRALVPAVPPALEAVCLKALSKERAQRYPTGQALADEVQRWLADEPVAAYREPWLARARRWTSRHHTLVAASIAAVLVATLSLTAATVLLADANRHTRDALALAEERGAEAEEQRDQARINFQLARDAVDEYCTKVSDEPRLKEKDLEELRRQLLQTAAKFHEKFLRQRGSDVGQKAELGRAYIRLARLTGSIGDRDKCLALMRQGLGIFQELAALHPDSAEYRDELATAHWGLGNWLEGTGRVQQAAGHYRQGLALWERLTEEVPGETKYATSLGGVQTDLGDLLRRTATPTEALPWYARATRTLERVYRKNQDDLPGRLLAGAYECQGNCYRMLRRRPEGVASCLKALRLRKWLFARHAGIPLYEEDLSRTLHVLALLYEGAGQKDKGLATLREARALAQRAADAHPAVSSYKESLAGTLTNLALAYKRVGKQALARQTLREALPLFEGLVAKNPTVMHYRFNFALVHLNLADLYLEDGRREQALAHFVREAELLTSLDPGYPRVYELYLGWTKKSSELVGQLDREGLAGKREEFRRLVLAARSRLAGLDPEKVSHPVDVGGACCNLGIALDQMNHPAQAAESFQQAIRTLEWAVRKNDADSARARDFLGNSQVGLAALYTRTGKPAQAEKAYAGAAPHRERLVADHPGQRRYQVALASLKSAQGALALQQNQLDAAKGHYLRALEVSSRLALAHSQVAEHQVELARVHFNLGLVHHRAKRDEDAIASYRKAQPIQERLVAEHPGVAAYQTDLARTYGELSRSHFLTRKPEEGVASLQRELSVREKLARDHPRRREFRVELARAQLKLGGFQVILGKPESAMQSLHKALPLFQELLKTAPPAEAADHRASVAGCYTQLGKAHAAAGKPEEALAAFQHARQIVEQLDSRRPGVPARVEALARGFLQVGTSLIQQRAFEQAGVALRRARELAGRGVASSDRQASFRETLLNAQFNLGVLHAVQDQTEEAFEGFRQAVSCLKGVDLSRPPMQGLCSVLVKNVTTLGNLYAKQGKSDRAVEAYRLALAAAGKAVEVKPKEPRPYLDLLMGHNTLGSFYRKNGKLDEASDAYRRQVVIARQMTDQFPQLPGISGLHGSGHLYLGQMANDLQKFKPALADFDRAITLLQGALKREKIEKLIAIERAWLRDAHHGRAFALTRLGSHREAIAACDRAVELASGAQKSLIRLLRARERALLGDHERAAAEVEQVVEGKNLGGLQWYNAACAVALAAAAAGKDAGKKPQEQEKLTEQYARRAVALLSRAQDAGYFKTPRLVAHLQNDPDLACLVKRADYQKLLEQVRQATAAAAKKAPPP